MGHDGGAALVTGATGFIGRALVERLSAMGGRVVVLSRKPAASVGGAEVVRADLAAPNALPAGLFKGVTRVFHCAGELRNVGTMAEVHIGGTTRLLRALADSDAAGNVHWVQLSSVGAYGPAPRPGEPRAVDETTSESPEGPYESTKTQSDCIVRQAAESGLISATLLRPSAVVGSGMSNASLPGLIAMVRRGLFFYIGPDGSMANYVHVDDVVQALLLCSTHPRAAGRTFNLSSDCTWRELVERIAAISGVRRPRFRIPAPLARRAAHVGAFIPSFPLSAARVDVLISRTHYPSDRIRTHLGFEFARPMPDGVDDIVKGKLFSSSAT